MSLPSTASPIAKLRALRRMVCELKPEVVHSYSFYTNFPAYWGTRGTKSIAIGSLRSDFRLDKKAAGPGRGELCARWPRFQISNNFLAAQIARSAFGPFVPRRVSVVRNGLDLQGFNNRPLGVNGRVRILGIGSLLPVKRWDRLLKALAELKERGFRFVLQIAGEGPLRSQLKEQGQKYGLSEDLELLGHVNDVSELLSQSTLLAHTSDTEGCPNAVMEAMACGRAVVATDVGDIPHLVEDGVTGYVVPRDDEALLVRRLADLIARPELCRRMGEAGRCRAEKEFSLERLVSETLDAYRLAGWRN